MKNVIENVLSEIIVNIIEFVIKQIMMQMFIIKDVTDNDLNFIKKCISENEINTFTFNTPQVDMKGWC